MIFFIVRLKKIFLESNSYSEKRMLKIVRFIPVFKNDKKLKYQSFMH